MQAIRAIATLLRRKRVRGWNLLSSAAARHRSAYASWIRKAEPRLLPKTDAAPIALGSIAVILIGRDESGATRQSLTSAFGADVAILSEAAFRSQEARHDWVLPIRAGDQVAPSLGAVLAQRLAGCAAQIVYWDEDRLEGRGRTAPWVKPDWDPLLFGAHDGLIGSCVLRNALIPDFVDDWAELARGIASDPESVVHVPLILTHRSTSRRGSAKPVAVCSPVSVSVVIPTRDGADILATCLAGLSRTRFPGDHEILVVDNGSEQPATHALLARLRTTGAARVLEQPGPFNFAALCNTGVSAARGDLVCLLNNDIEIVESDWLTHMADLATTDGVGAVGARLLYPDGSLQHAGVVIGIGDAAGHVGKGTIPAPGAFAPWYGETRTTSAVTAACLLVDRAKYLTVGGMDAGVFAVDFNDVDLCLRLARNGWQTVYCAHATLIHHESKTRGLKRGRVDQARFERELAALRTRWGTVGAVDPYYSRLFRRQSEDRVLAF